METVVSLVKEVTIGDVALDRSGSAGTEECSFCPKLVVPTSVTALFLEM